MSTEQYFFWGMAAFLVICFAVFAYRNRKPTIRATVSSIGAQMKPLTAAAEQTSADLLSAALAAIEKDGARKAVNRMTDQFAESHAAEYSARIQKITAPPKDQTPTVPPSAS